MKKLIKYNEAKKQLINKEILTEDEKNWNDSVKLGLSIMKKQMFPSVGN